MQPGGHAPLDGAAQDKDGGEQPRLDPLYKRLPRGPHRLNREQVRDHQRGRLQGAMVEAVARSGYREASVKQVIALAGVSRRSFYEQFANKEACFLATFEEIAARELRSMRAAYLETPGGLRPRLLAAFERCEDAVRERPKEVLLVAHDAQCAGPAGAQALRRALAACEEMLDLTLRGADGGSRLPAPVVRAVAGGLHGAVVSRLRRGELADTELAAELLSWTMAFGDGGPARARDLLQRSLKTRMREISVEQRRARFMAPAARSAGGERERLIESILRLAAIHPYGEIAAPQVAEEAGLSIESFFEHFPDREACFTAALDQVAGGLLDLTRDPELDGDRWPAAVRRTIGSIMDHLAARPLHARALVQQSFRAGAEAAAWSVDLSEQLSAALLRGAPAPASSLAGDAAAGALWHTIRCQAAGGRTALLGALPDHVSYVVLTPYIGARPTTEVLVSES